MSLYLSVKVFLILSIFGVCVRAGGSCHEDCGENAFCNSCGNHCEIFCSDTDTKPCTRICNPAGCQCNENFVRDKSTNKCVRREDCYQS